MERLRFVFLLVIKASDDHNLQKLDLEVKHKNEINRAKKLFETELMQMRTDSEMHMKNYNEVLKSNKQLLNRTKDFEAEILNLDRMREDLKNQLNSCERKRNQLQMEKEDVSSRLDAAEKTRKNTELTVKDLNQTVNELSLSLTSANNEVKRLNSDLISMQGVLEDSHVVRRNLEETTERFRLDADQLRESLEYHNDVIRQKDDVIQKLEKDLKITRELLDEMEQKTLREGRKLFAKAQAKSKSLELELEAEQKKLKELHSENRRLQKSINELADLKESFERETHEKSRLLDSAHNLIARLKKQLAEAEQVVTIVTGKYKKLQQRLNQEESDRQELSTPNNLQSVILERHISSAGSGGGQHATGSHLPSVNQLTASSHHIPGSHLASGGHLVSGSHLASIGHLKPSVGHVGSSGLYTVGSRKSIPIGDMVNQRISTARSVVQSIISNNSLNYE
ncbi:hypothetical protein HELRODRAFT_99227 [Helobdella robusta]|uniref:Myosin tail domain-containing protein n=1 Tax=Helobdella robusta TaxID=6412 RepID=T1G9R5_HELRO|nr:hypothetical protein HELRODRAFT_99227 [Helobdella robusta]ESO04872.1 hypothetical protein HELRODRAFT_99227 [Helobdella robusta]